MNKEEELSANKFIGHIAKIIYSNPTNLSILETLYETIYYELIHFELNNRDRSISIHHLFPIFISYYKENPNINCYQTPIIKKFLLFEHHNALFPNLTKDLNPIKLFIPLDKEHIEIGLKSILNYAINEDIAFEAKMADGLRSDNIVIRVPRLEDAMKLIAYVNNNSYIKKGFLPSNPFCFEIFNVGLAIDGNKSYNTVLARLITEYIREEYKMDELEKANLSKFVNYLNTKCIFNEEELDEIRRLVAMASYKNCNLSDFYNIYSELSKNKKLINSMDEEAPSCKEAFQNVVVATVKKYGFSITKERIGRFIQFGNARLFSRYDKSKSETINYRNILIGLLGEKYKTYEKRLKLLNEMCDVNGYATLEAIEYYLEKIILPIIEKEAKTDIESSEENGK